jgi:chromosome segregation ATPase
MGNATIKRNLKVEGWLEAKNIKNFLKGLFPTMDALKDAYPEPQIGWVALIGDTLPANIAIVNEDGKWQLTSNKSDDLEVNLTNYVDNADLDTKLEGYYKVEDANELATRVGELEATADDAHNALVVATEASNRINDLNNAVQVNSENFDLAMGRINENTDTIGVITRKNIEQDGRFTTIQKTIDDNNTYIATLENRVQNAEDVIDTKTTTLETTNATQNLWHEAHSIVNLHRLPKVPTVIEKNTIGEYIGFVPSRLVRNGLIVLGYNGEEWEAWQLINAEDKTSQSSYKKLDWDNSTLEMQIKNIQEDVSNLYGLDEAQAITLDEHMGLIAQLQSKDTEHDNAIAGINQAIAEVRKDFIASDTADFDILEGKINDNVEELGNAIIAEADLREAKDTELNNQALQLQRQLDSITLEIRELTLRLDALTNQ